MIELIFSIGIVVAVLVLLWSLRAVVMNWMQEKDLAWLQLLAGITDPMDQRRFEQKRQTKAMMILCLTVGWPLLKYQWSYLVMVLIGVIVVYKQPYKQLQRQQRQLIRQLKQQFPLWLRQLQILLQNHTVLQAMSISLAKSPLILRPSIEQLIRRIEVDPVSILPYLDFMKEFEIYEIQKAMKLLYRYHFVGAEESYQQFHRMIEATGKWLRQARNETKVNQMMMLQWLGMIPLLGVTLMFLVMMVILVMDMMKGGI